MQLEAGGAWQILGALWQPVGVHWPSRQGSLGTQEGAGLRSVHDWRSKCPQTRKVRPEHTLVVHSSVQPALHTPLLHEVPDAHGTIGPHSRQPSWSASAQVMVPAPRHCTELAVHSSWQV